MKIVAWALITVVATGCVPAPENIQGTYVSPHVYGNYSCERVRTELTRIGARVQEVSAAQSAEATTAAVASVAATAALLLVAPGFFFMSGGGKHAQELARLKGQVEALRQVAVDKGCTELLEEIERERRKQEKEAE